MKVNFYATLRDIVGSKTVDVPVDHSITIRQLVEQLVVEYPGLGEKLIDPEGEIYGYVHILVNGRDHVYLPGAMDAVLKGTDTVSIFPAVGGG
jgi:molybdopterin synthase sulfur carrier subunit